MTRIDDKIQLNGDACEIHRDTGSVADSYGDITPIWGKVSGGDEYCWIQKPQLGGKVATAAGILDEADRLIFLQSSTVSRDMDMIVVGSTSYVVKKLNEKTMIRNETSHYEALCRLVEEG